MYWDKGDYAHAGQVLQESAEITRKVMGEDSPVYAISLTDLARVYERQGDLVRAEQLFRRADRLYKESEEEEGLTHGLRRFSG